MTGSSFEPAAKLRATSARLSSLNGAILYDVDLDLESEVSKGLVGVQGQVDWCIDRVHT